MRKTYLLWFAFLAFLVLNCREEVDYVTNQQQSNRAEEFFKNTETIDKKGNAVLVSNSIRKLKTINGKIDFLSSISDKTGIPIWNSMLETNLHSNHNHDTTNKGNEETTETLIIPLRQEDNFLSSVMYVENPDSDSPNIYTVTNEQLEEFVNNEEIDKSIRESVLMTFLSFDHKIFGERKYSPIPGDFFENVFKDEQNDFKTFEIENVETSASNRQVMECIDVYACVGGGSCQTGTCDRCNLCVSKYCYSLGSPGTYTGSTGGNTGGNNGGGTGNGNQNSIPWYLANPNIYNYNGNVRAIFKSLYDYGITLQDEQLDYLQGRSTLTNTIKNCLTNNTLAKSRFVEDMLNDYTFAYPQPDTNVLITKLNTFHTYLFNIYPNIDWQSFNTYFFIHNLSTTQLNNILSTGYPTSYTENIKKLSLKEFNDIIQINLSIANSPYEEEYVKETNEAFAAFGAYADIDNMTETQIEYVLNNNCCVGLFFNALAREKVKLVAANYKLLRKLYPSWSKGKVFWYAGRETLHLLLDIAGTVPVIGEVCDITNGAIYTIEGDALNASLSYAGAIPIAGWGATGAKFAIKTVAGGISLAIVKNADGFYEVARNQQLFRKVLGMVKNDGRIAHHIIPFALQTNPVIQKAMLSKNAFMINEALNGIPVNSAVHVGSHSNYNNIIKTYLNNWNSSNPNATPDQAYNFAMFVIQKAKTAIQNNPNIKINDLTF